MIQIRVLNAPALFDAATKLPGIAELARRGGPLTDPGAAVDGEIAARIRLAFAKEGVHAEVQLGDFPPLSPGYRALAAIVGGIAGFLLGRAV